MCFWKYFWLTSVLRDIQEYFSHMANGINLEPYIIPSVYNKKLK